MTLSMLSSLTPSLSQALSEKGYDALTPVQEAVTQPDLAASDLLVSAQTGSGKTVGFGLAIAPTILGGADAFGPAAAPLALVVAPTRELALQVMRELRWLYDKSGASIVSCVGGMDMRGERRALERGAHIVVGTPGRLRDHIERGSLDLGDVRAVVLDEADEMLDLGFREDLEFMLGRAPEGRRTLMFSATVPPAIATLAERFQRDARRITTLGGAKQHADIAYQVVQVAAQDTEHAIFNLLRFHDSDSAIVFANTRAAVNHLTARLANRGFGVVTLSGELSQTERTHALQAMRDGRARICVATDVAARGIDLPNLNLVIHADLPTNTESLLHRSGRTGRAGRKGISALIVPMKAARRVERLLKWAKINAEWTLPPSADDILRQDEERLLNDPAWAEPPGEGEAEFAARLLERYKPQEIAAAYLRLYRARQAAPEDLLPPDTKEPPRAPRDFGPSAWVALSVGRDQRAEPRWLLPLLCRAGNLDKSAVGAIRVQEAETFVELSERAVAGFMAVLGEGGTLEDGIKVRRLENAPDLGPPRRAPQKGGPRGPRPPSDAPRPERPAPRQEAAPPAAPRSAPAAPPAPPPPEPAAAPGPRPVTAKHRAKPGGAPKHAGGKPPAKGAGKPGAAPKKPSGKPGAGPKKPRPASKPADARDTSARFTPPGKPKAKRPAKPAPARKGGDAPPRRPKR